MVDSTDFAQVIVEAEDIAQSVAQRTSSAHLLLAMFTVQNRAQVLLKERGVDEDVLLSLLSHAPNETEGLLRDLCSRAREIAQTCGSPETDCLHALIAATRVRCLAQELLAKAGLDLTVLRNTALSYYLSGHMPRRLQLDRDPASRRAPSRPIGSPPLPRPSRSATAAATVVREPPRLAPEPEPRPGPAIEEQPLAEPTRAPIQPLALDPKAFPLLCALGRNLSLSAAEGRLDPVVGRTKEVDEVIDVLGKRRTNNPCLVGEPGVGKTAVVEGVAQQLLSLRGGLGERVIIELDVANLVAGTQLRGSFSEKLNALKDEVRRAEGRVVVFIDEVHTLIGAGSTGDGPQDAANELKGAMARGEFPCIGATTHDEFRKFITNDPALERRFTPVVVKEPSVTETTLILEGIIERYEAHHALTYAPETLSTAAALAARYVTDRFLPDKAVSIVDLAGSRCRREGRSRVEPADVARVVAKLAGLPEERLLTTDSERLLRLEDDLAARIIGHRQVVARLAAVIRRNYAGFASRRPMGSFLFLGPTGVGKTETAKALADVLFGSPAALVRIDMSELSERHSVSRLIGAPAGYVGYGDGGQLTEPVRRQPSSVVVLDEIEKAHRDVWMLLLQVLDEGRLTDGKGRHIDFSNTVVIMTTNLGAESLVARQTVGFGTASTEGNRVQQAESSARKALPPELWNRIDERCVFEPLSVDDVAAIARLLLAQSSVRLASEKGITFEVSTAVVARLLDEGGFDTQLGARPMRQTIQRLIEGPLSERILAGELLRGAQVKVELRHGRITFERG